MLVFLLLCELVLAVAELVLWPLIGIGLLLLWGHPRWGQEVLLLAGLLLGLSTLADKALEDHARFLQEHDALLRQLAR